MPTKRNMKWIIFDRGIYSIPRRIQGVYVIWTTVILLSINCRHIQHEVWYACLLIVNQYASSNGLNRTNLACPPRDSRESKSRPILPTEWTWFKEKNNLKIRVLINLKDLVTLIFVKQSDFENFRRLKCNSKSAWKIAKKTFYKNIHNF